MSPILFYRVHTDGTVTGEVRADSIHEARTQLACHSDEYVTSAASHAIGFPHPLPTGRCVSCGVRPGVRRYGETGSRCAVCERREHNDQKRTSEARRSGTPLPPAHVAEMTVELQRAMLRGVSPVKVGRPKKVKATLAGK